jgi:hypothetical protein
MLTGAYKKFNNETISILQNGLHRTKIEIADKALAIKKLYEIAARAENNFIADWCNENFERLIKKNMMSPPGVVAKHSVQ